MSFQSVHFTDVVSQKYIGGVIGGVTRGNDTHRVLAITRLEAFIEAARIC